MVTVKESWSREKVVKRPMDSTDINGSL